AQGLAAQLTADFTAPPMLGKDTAAVLADVLGYSAETIDQLIGSGAVSVYAPAAEPIPA
ncbi:MAG: CoA transferase, partial [Mesorhizobium sp.]